MFPSEFKASHPSLLYLSYRIRISAYTVNFILDYTSSKNAYIWSVEAHDRDSVRWVQDYANPSIWQQADRIMVWAVSKQIRHFMSHSNIFFNKIVVSKKNQQRHRQLISILHHLRLICNLFSRLQFVKYPESKSNESVHDVRCSTQLRVGVLIPDSATSPITYNISLIINIKRTKGHWNLSIRHETNNDRTKLMYSSER